MPRPGESGSPSNTERNYPPGTQWHINRERDGVRIKGKASQKDFYIPNNDIQQQPARSREDTITTSRNQDQHSNNGRDARHGSKDKDVSDRRIDDRNTRDRRKEDDYRSGRRDYSNDRRRDDDRVSGRGSDRRRRSRDRDYRDDRRDDRSYRDRRDYRDRDDRDRRSRRDDSRDRVRRRDDRDRSPPRGGRGERDRRDSRDGRARDNPRHAAPPGPTENELKQIEEEKKRERLAKIEAWKKQVAEDKARKEKEQSTGAQTPLTVDNKADLSSFSSPKTPRTPQSPANYAGKFDPKAIAKKAAAKTAALKSLGGDVPMLDASLRGNTDIVRPSSGRPLAAPAPIHTSGPIARGNVSGFGLGKSAAPVEVERGTKRGLALGEEESSRKRIERLPTPPLADGAITEASATGAAQDNDEDETTVDAQDEEGEAAAARAAAEKREERLLAEAAQTPVANDVDMENVPATETHEEEEEIDPLDAFMSDLGKTTIKAPGLGMKSTKMAQQQEPQAIYSDEDEMDTMENDTEDILDVVAKSKKKKDIPKVDHSKANYEPFNKNFYTEPTDVAELTEEDTKNLRFELDDIKVRGKNVPKPVQKWPQFGLGVQSLDVIQKLGYEKPSSIQAQAVPAIMSGRDVIGIAKTGSGKTVAFLLPMFRHIKDQKALKSLDGPIGLIMTPTRELATQIHKECRPWLKALGLRAVCAYGGAPIKDQIAELKRGAEIVVCTPGRMIDLLAANSGRVTNLRRVTYIVLDEADRMFDMGFEPQVMKVMGNVRPDRQTVLFSATFPKNMEALARKVLHDPVEIVVGGRSVVAPEITQIVEVRPENSKFMRLLQLLGEVHEDEDARSLVFVDKQEAAEELMNAILRKGYPCFTIHGGKDQYDRDSVISDFKAGVFPVLVATSVAARGLDVKQLKMVVNFDCPNHLEDYVHRAGRTGRAGQTGQAVTFVTPEQGRYAIDIVKALTQSEQQIPEALQKLVDTTTEEIKAGKGKAAALGFGGKGLDRLDQDRDAARKRERGAFKTGDDPEDDEDKKKDKDKEEDKLPEIKAAGAAPAPAASAHEDLFNQPIEVLKRATPEPGGKVPDRITRVNAAVEAINARLRKTGEVRSATALDNRGPDAGAFHATLQINDFPQKARWAVTNRANVAKILESTGTSITTKGTYYKPGTDPQPDSGDLPKLYVLVEGDTEVVVQTACRELMRLLKEGTLAEASSQDRAPAGRYSVV